MKKMFLLQLLFALFSTAVFAQLNSQSLKWVVQNVEIDFTQSPPQYNSLTTGSYDGGANSFTDSGGDLIFQIIDNKIKSPDGTQLAQLNILEDQGQEIAVIEKANSCNEFVTFYLKREYASQFTREALHYSSFKINPETNQLTMLSDDILINQMGLYVEGFGGIAVTQSKSDGSRDLYYAHMKDGYSGCIQKISVSANGTVSSPVEVFGGFYNNTGVRDNFYISELELSHDGTKLAFSRLQNFSGYSNSNQDVVIFDRNTATGSLSNGTVVELESNDASYNYPGIEFDHLGEKLFVIGDGDNGSLYRINLANNAVTEIDILPENSHSMLELGKDGSFYIATATKLKKMDDDGNFTDFVTNNNMAKNSLLDWRGVTMYLLPDQIDGQDYSQCLSGTECCYTWSTTPANDAMQGVQIQTSGDDRNIIIQSGNSVTWTATSNSFGNVAEAFMGKGDIIIEPGASLTIEDMIIHFREGYEIQMDDNPSGVGSRLTLDNTTLTVFDECEGDKFWAGIDLSGGWDGQLQIPFSSCKQPYLKMLNDSKIEFAVRGVDAAAGGLVRAYDSDFVNNIVSVTITGYTDQHSHFQNCGFIWDDEIYAKNENPSIHLHMWTASGVGVKGCRFKNEAALSENYPNRGVGIIADYTDFDLDGLCLDSPSLLPCINYQNNLFSRLYFGIKSNSGDNILVDRCDFTETQRGAWIISSTALQFTRNDLDLFDNHGSLHDESSFGLYLESCTGYQVEENTFRDGALGLVIYNSGADENLVYLNDFDNIQDINGLGTSIVSMGLNSHATTKKQGLQYICNKFENYDFAITITSGSLTTSNGVVTVDNSYIRYEQGRDVSTNLARRADNLFGILNSPINSEADFYIDDNMIPWNYKYLQHTDNMTNFDSYLRYYDYKAHPSTFGTFTTRAQECPSNLSSGVVIIIPTLSTLNNKEAEQDSLESEYNALLVDVNELELVIAAQTASEVNQQAVHNSLMEASPNLTDTILSSYLLNDNANELSRTSVMIANSPLPSSVKEDIELSNLSSELKYYISQYQTGVNRLEDLENKIQKTKASRQYLTDRLQLQYVHNASKESQLDWINYLENKTNLHSKLKLADMYIKQNQMSEAQTLLANIETMLTGTENTERLKQVKVKQIELALRQDMSCQELPSSDLTYLYDLAEDYNHKSGGDARAILMASGLESYEPIVILPNPNQEKSAIVDNSHENTERQSITPELQSRFDIFPNPVDDKLSVEFISMEETCDFVVYDMQGKIVKQLTRNEGLGYFVLDVADLQSGNYILYSPQLSEKKQFVVKR